VKAVLVVLVAMVCLPAFSEEKTCTVKGMTCANCVDTVKEKVCNPNFSVCDVTLNKKAKMGEIHVMTKDATAKIDEKTLSDAIKDTTYSVQKCTNGAPKTASKKS
jgi:copper chaperone CopZ